MAQKPSHTPYLDQCQSVVRFPDVDVYAFHSKLRQVYVPRTCCTEVIAPHTVSVNHEGRILANVFSKKCRKIRSPNENIFLSLPSGYGHGVWVQAQLM